MRRLAGAGLAWALVVLAPSAHAAEDTDTHHHAALEAATTGTVVLPTQVVARRSRSHQARQRRVAARLDGLLLDTAEDLGLVLDASEEDPDSAPNVERHALLAFATKRHKLVVLPILRELPDDRFELELLAARPGAKALSTRVERVKLNELSVRAVVMLRDIVTMPSPRDVVAKGEPASSSTPTAAPHSEGRAILATNGTLFGGLVGFSLQRAAGSDDPRLLYPLIGVGAGVGLGAAWIISDEWDVGVGDAWYLAAGAWWPGLAGHLIYAGRFADLPHANHDEAWSFGLISSTTGLTLSIVGLLPNGMTGGGAVLAHSGGALGMLVGGLAEFTVTGVTNEVPYAGLGYGALGGWLLASTTAIYFQPDAWRTLSIDLGILLGGLAGASAASPLLFGDQTPTKTRGWVGATGGGLVVGGVVAWWLTTDDEPEPEKTASTCREGRSPYACSSYWRRTMMPLPTTLTMASGPGELEGSGVGVAWSGELW